MFEATANSTRAHAKRLAAVLDKVHASDRMTATAWFGRLETTAAASSNVEAQELPYQRWYRFKEAFSPRFVSAAVSSLSRRPAVCVDPFGGSGTTALTCQFLGIQPVTIEVNPFLADLIEAKLQKYDVTKLIQDLARVHRSVKEFKGPTRQLLGDAPSTFVEPGVDGRWIFDASIARRLLVYRQIIEQLENQTHRTLFRILLASIAVGVSNVVISGKGRRYRANWSDYRANVSAVDKAFRDAAELAIQDIARFGRRAEDRYTLLRGDARSLVAKLPEAEFALFSPPYPNSFDYTDIYNVELWLLGYLSSGESNRALREATLRSHVQIKRSFDGDLPSSKLLKKTVSALKRNSDNLWNPHIPAMVGAYFVDLGKILSGLSETMARKADVMLVVGDSRYASVHVDVAAICAEMAPSLGFKVKTTRPIRAMRSSAQQGGHHILSETLIHLKR